LLSDHHRATDQFATRRHLHPNQQQFMTPPHNQHQINPHLRGPMPHQMFPNQPRGPGPNQRPTIPPYHHQQPQQQRPPFNPVNFAAQALIQQQLMNQAARARLYAQASLLQQQPQVI